MKISQLDSSINKYYFNLLLKGKKVYQQIINGRCLLSDSYILSVVNYDNNFIGLNYCKSADLNSFLKKLFEEDSDYKNVENISLDLVESDLVHLKAGDLDVIINKKYYTIYKKQTFKVISDIKPVLIYNGHELIGFILPVKRY